GLGSTEHPMLPSHLCGCRPQPFRNRQASAVRTPPTLEASVNPLHANRNLRQCLRAHRRSSVPCRDYNRRYQLRPRSFMQVYRKLTIEVLVVDVQARMHTFLDHTRPKLTGRLLRHHAIEDHLPPVRPPQIQIVANDLFEELTPAQGTVEDLRQTDFHLPDRQVPVVARLPVFRPQGKRNPPQPLAKHPVDVLRPQPVADLL